MFWSTFHKLVILHRKSSSLSIFIFATIYEERNRATGYYLFGGMDKIPSSANIKTHYSWFNYSLSLSCEHKNRYWVDGQTTLDTSFYLKFIDTLLRIRKGEMNYHKGVLCHKIEFI